MPAAASVLVRPADPKHDRVLEEAMRRSPGKSVLWGLALLATMAAAAEPPSRLKLAEELARAHAASPQGRDWLQQNASKAGQLMIPVLNKCVEDAPDGELTPFSVYLRLSQKGRIQEIVTELDAELGRCMTKESREVQLPAAPREDFWFQLNLAAML
jgi:hypothetical protein